MESKDLNLSQDLWERLQEEFDQAQQANERLHVKTPLFRQAYDPGTREAALAWEENRTETQERVSELLQDIDTQMARLDSLPKDEQLALYNEIDNTLTTLNGMIEKPSNTMEDEHGKQWRTLTQDDLEGVKKLSTQFTNNSHAILKTEEKVVEAVGDLKGPNAERMAELARRFEYTEEEREAERKLVDSINAGIPPQTVYESSVPPKAHVDLPPTPDIAHSPITPRESEVKEETTNAGSQAPGVVSEERIPTDPISNANLEEGSSPDASPTQNASFIQGMATFGSELWEGLKSFYHSAETFVRGLMNPAQSSESANHEQDQPAAERVSQIAPAPKNEKSVVGTLQAAVEHFRNSQKLESDQDIELKDIENKKPRGPG